VTVELNGRVAIRAQDRDASPPTELVLNRSSRVGDEVRFCTDRTLLSRALELGFGEIAIQTRNNRWCAATSAARTVWALLTPDGAIGPAPTRSSSNRARRASSASDAYPRSTLPRKIENHDHQSHPADVRRDARPPAANGVPNPRASMR
jgi:hypothetical protein